MARKPRRSGTAKRKTTAQRKATHKSKYGTSKLPARKHRNQR
ncbi:MAG: hypothetical protein U9N34_10390 [Candidatus Cloacimonadota bacterium]|nr:hypothetical protein [Candidatus Cloacimonadota bacterium]